MTWLKTFASWIVLLLLAGFGAGCGQSTRDFVATGDSPGGNSPSVITGSFSLGRYVSGGTATLESLDGAVVAQSDIGATGNFFFSSQVYPADFRVRCVPANTEASFSTDVRGYDGSGRYVVVNVPTSLVSQYLKRHPSEGLDSARERVCQYLKLAPGTDLEYGLSETRRCSFSHLAFFVNAAQAGGWAALSSQTVAEIEQASTSNQEASDGTPAPFFVNRSDLTASLEGLEPGLSHHILPLQTFRPLVLSFVHDVTKGLLGKALPGLGDSALNITTDVADGLITTIAEHFGLNLGPKASLDEIQDELVAVLDDLNTINNTLISGFSKQDYQAAAGVLAPAIAYIETLTQTTLKSAAETAQQNNLPSDKPLSGGLPSGMTNFLTSVSDFEDTVDIQLIQDYQSDGSSQDNMNTTWRQFNIDEVLPVQDDRGLDRFMNFPWRSNQLLDLALTNYTYYAGYQQSALVWIAQNARQDSKLASSINTAMGRLQDGAVSLKQQRGQFPQPLLSDQVVVDLQYGVMWYTTMQSPDTWDNASSIASQLKVTGSTASGQVVYDDWRLATYEELQSLQERASFYNGGSDPNLPVKSSDYGNIGSSTAGLPGLGFLGVADALKSDDNGGKPEDGGMWYASHILVLTGYYSIPSWGVKPYSELEFNHDQTINYKGDKDKRPYFVCRSIGAPLLPYYDPKNPPGATNPQLPFPYPDALIPNPVIPAEFPGLGVVTGFGSVGAISHSKATADLVYTIYLGGDFTTGTDLKFDHHSVSNSELVSTVALYSGGINQDPQYNSLVMVPWFSTSGSDPKASTSITTPTSVQVSNAPPAFDLEDGPTALLSALNTFGSSGTIVKKTDSTAVQTAYLTGQAYAYDPSTNTFPSIVSRSGDMSQPGTDDNGNVRQPKILQVSPRNRYYDGTGVSASGTAREYYYASLFYDNGTVDAKAAPDVTWSLVGVDASGQPFAVSNRVAVIDDQGELQVALDRVPLSGLDLQVTATVTFNGVTYTDTVNVHAAYVI